MDKKLTNSEIVKALECCSSDDLTNLNCSHCPNQQSNCMVILYKNSLDLIIHLQAENTELLVKIEQLKNDKVHIASDNAYFQSVIQNLEAEVERLKAQLEGIKYGE